MNLINKLYLNLFIIINHHKQIKFDKNIEKFKRFLNITNGKINENNIIKYLEKYTKRPLHSRVIGKIREFKKNSKIGL